MWLKSTSPYINGLGRQGKAPYIIRVPGAGAAPVGGWHAKDSGMKLQRYDLERNFVVIQPANPQEIKALRAVVAVVAAQYDDLDEVILNVAPDDVMRVMAALDDALEQDGDMTASLTLDMRHVYYIFRMLGSVGQEYPILPGLAAEGITRDLVGALDDAFYKISRQIPEGE